MSCHFDSLLVIAGIIAIQCCHLQSDNQYCHIDKLLKQFSAFDYHRNLVKWVKCDTVA